MATIFRYYGISFFEIEAQGHKILVDPCIRKNRICPIKVEDIAEALKPLLHEKEAKKAIKILSEDFTSNDSVGAVRVARFITGSPDEAIQAEVDGFVRNLLDLCKLDEI